MSDTSINLGNQYLTFDYRHSATGIEFNTLLRDGIKPGIYKGGALTYAGNTIYIAPFVAYIEDDTLMNKIIRVETKVTASLNLTPYVGFNTTLSLNYIWQNISENWASFNARSSGSSPITQEVILGEIIFTDDVITGVDYSKKTWGGRHEDIVPIGTIQAYLPGYFTATNNVGYTAVSIPLSSNWKLCDGTEYFDMDSPLFNADNRFLPLLTDNRFLMGSTTLGSISTAGGTNLNTVTLAQTNLPAHTHTYIHTHGISHTHFGTVYGDAGGGTLSGSVPFGSWSTAGNNSEYTLHSIEGTPNTGITSPSSIDNTSSQSATVSGDGSGTFNATAFSILPKYLSCSFMIRVK